jgi:hypothetical protein
MNRINSKKLSIALIIIILILVIFYYKFFLKKSDTKNKASCDIHKCGSEDPVSDPDYNMKEISKQSILLEEHLVEKNKRCKDCIAKHFLHIVGLSEEAVCLAGSSVSKYPLMDSNASFYNKLFEQWKKNKDDENNLQLIQDKLRIRRKELVSHYVL